jgi:hypothetical protein
VLASQWPPLGIPQGPTPTIFPLLRTEKARESGRPAPKMGPNVRIAAVVRVEGGPVGAVPGIRGVQGVGAMVKEKVEGRVAEAPAPDEGSSG